MKKRLAPEMKRTNTKEANNGQKNKSLLDSSLHGNLSVKRRGARARVRMAFFFDVEQNHGWQKISQETKRSSGDESLQKTDFHMLPSTDTPAITASISISTSAA